MLQFIDLIFRKEMKEIIRDKRSWLPIIAVSAFMPLMMMGSLYFTEKLEGDDESQVYSIAGSQNAPALISFLNTQGIITTEENGDKNSEENDDEKDGDSIQLIIPDDFQQKLATGYLPNLVIRADYSSDREDVRNLEGALEAYASEIGLSRLVSRGVSPLALRPFEIDIQDTGDISFMARFLAPLIIFIFIMVPIPALMPAAIDSTAGERERHGLFPLMLQPIPAISIPIGKYLALVVSGMASLAISVSVGFTGFSNIQFDGMNIGLDMSVANGVMFLGILLPTVMALAAAIMGVASFAKTFKEGQTYVGLSPFLPMGFFGAGFVLDEAWRPYIPFWSENMVASSLLSGEAINWIPWLIVVAGYFLVVGLSLWWMSRSIRRQALASSA